MSFKFFIFFISIFCNLDKFFSTIFSIIKSIFNSVGQKMFILSLMSSSFPWLYFSTLEFLFGCFVFYNFFTICMIVINLFIDLKHIHFEILSDPFLYPFPQSQIILVDEVSFTTQILTLTLIFLHASSFVWKFHYAFVSDFSLIHWVGFFVCLFVFVFFLVAFIEALNVPSLIQK